MMSGRGLNGEETKGILMGELIFISPCLAGRHYLAMPGWVELMLVWGILVRHNLIRNSDVAANYMICPEHRLGTLRSPGVLT